MNKPIVHFGIINISAPGFTDIDSDVTGIGLYDVGADATLGLFGNVGVGEAVLLSNWHPGGSYGASALDIGETAKFHGLAFLQYVTPPASAHAPANEQSNIGLEIPGTFWDSYSYKNDMLRLWHGSSVVEALHLVVADRYGITVQAAPGGWAFISANTATTHGIDFLGTLHPPGAPVHT